MRILQCNADDVFFDILLFIILEVYLMSRKEQQPITEENIKKSGVRGAKKFLKDQTEGKTINLFKMQINQINMILSSTGGSLTDFVRQAVDEKIDRYYGTDEQDPYGFKQINENTILIPATVYKELEGIGDSALTAQRKKGKIKIYIFGGKQFVENLDGHKNSLMTQFLAFRHVINEKMSSMSDSLNEFMERVSNLEQMAQKGSSK